VINIKTESNISLKKQSISLSKSSWNSFKTHQYELLDSGI